MSRIRRQFYRIACWSNIIVGALGIVLGIILMVLGLLAFPLVIFIVTIPLIIGVLILGAATIIVGIIKIVLGLLALRGGKVAYGLLTGLAFLTLVMSVINLVLRWEEAQANLMGILAVALNAVILFVHLAGIVIVAPVFCRRYRPVCLVRR